MTLCQIIPDRMAPEPVPAALETLVRALSRAGARSWFGCLVGFLLLWAGVLSAFAAPTVSNVAFSQQNGTRLVDISYDLSGKLGGSVHFLSAIRNRCHVRLLKFRHGEEWSLVPC